MRLHYSMLDATRQSPPTLIIISIKSYYLRNAQRCGWVKWAEVILLLIPYSYTNKHYRSIILYAHLKCHYSRRNGWRSGLCSTSRYSNRSWVSSVWALRRLSCHPWLKLLLKCCYFNVYCSLFLEKFFISLSCQVNMVELKENDKIFDQALPNF